MIIPRSVPYKDLTPEQQAHVDDMVRRGWYLGRDDRTVIADVDERRMMRFVSSPRFRPDHMGRL